jgi:CrcB protein
MLIGCGGFIGSVSRYLATSFINNTFSQTLIPFGTFIVNATGCLMIGYLQGIFESKDILSPDLRMLIIVGFLGSFTTFSSFSYDTLIWASSRGFFHAGLNVFIHLAIGLPMVWLGIMLSKIV